MSTYQSCVDGLSASFFLYELEDSVRHLETQISTPDVKLDVYYSFALVENLG